MDLLEDPEGSGVSVPVSAEHVAEPSSKEAVLPRETSEATEEAAGDAPAAPPTQAATPFAMAASTAPLAPNTSLPGSAPLGATAGRTSSSGPEQQVLTCAFGGAGGRRGFPPPFPLCFHPISRGCL